MSPRKRGGLSLLDAANRIVKNSPATSVRLWAVAMLHRHELTAFRLAPYAWLCNRCSLASYCFHCCCRRRRRLCHCDWLVTICRQFSAYTFDTCATYRTRNMLYQTMHTRPTWNETHAKTIADTTNCTQSHRPPLIKLPALLIQSYK